MPKNYTAAEILGAGALNLPIGQYLDRTDITDSPEGTFKPWTEEDIQTLRDVKAELIAIKDGTQKVSVTGSILTTEMKDKNGEIITAGSELVVGTFVPSVDYKDVIFSITTGAWLDADIDVILQGTYVAGDYSGINPMAQTSLTWDSNVADARRQSVPVNLMGAAEYRLRVRNIGSTDETLYHVFRTERK